MRKLTMKPISFPNSPSHLWEHFYQITQIPRASKQEGEIRQYLIQLAEKYGHSWASDDIGNVVIYVAGTGGLEDGKTVIIQNHIDMVTVKTGDKKHDFSQDPLTLQIDNGWLKADRTTLGADNGVGCAAALALMTDKKVAHPPLELLFTVDEETGLGGALNLDASLLSGRRMLNLDTEDWGDIYIGCAGGKGWELSRPLAVEPVPDGHTHFKITIKGLAGGHSGIQIHQQHGNAIKLMGQWLNETKDLGIRLSSVNGGIAHNVIPRETTLEFSCEHTQLTDLERLNECLLERWLSYLPKADENVQLVMESTTFAHVLNQESQLLIEQLLAIYPHGAQSYSLAHPADLVDLSINLAVFKISEQQLYIESSMRFFNERESLALADNILSIAQVFKLSVKQILDYPGWDPEFNSPLLAQASELYKDMFNTEPKVKAIHAGLECGILKAKIGVTDVISFGPTILGAHSPTERLKISTVQPFWNYLLMLLKNM